MPRHSDVESSTAASLDDPLEGLLGYQLRRASHAMLDDLATVLNEFSIRPTTASVVLLVAANPGITQSRIGQKSTKGADRTAILEFLRSVWKGGK